MTTTLLSAAVDLNHPGDYLTWGVLSISVANAIVIGTMLVLFGLAMFLPFPKGKDKR
jgi:hypothetical protein